MKSNEVEYAKQIFSLATYYNNALVGIETNFSTYTQIELERLGYKNFFVRKVEDTIKDKLKKSFGFRTTTITRPLILGNLKRIVTENVEMINDKNTLEELLTFIRNEDGKEEAQTGYHDDLVMALAIVYYIREQQDTTLIEETNEEEDDYPEFSFNKKVDEII